MTQRVTWSGRRFVLNSEGWQTPNRPSADQWIQVVCSVLQGFRKPIAQQGRRPVSRAAFHALHYYIL